MRNFLFHSALLIMTSVHLYIQLFCFCLLFFFFFLRANYSFRLKVELAPRGLC